MIEEGELRAILDRLVREVEPIYDPEPPTRQAIQSIATVINDGWQTELQAIRERVTEAFDTIDRTLGVALTILDAQPGGCPERVRRLLRGEELIREEGPRTA